MQFHSVEKMWKTAVLLGMTGLFSATGSGYCAGREAEDLQTIKVEEKTIPQADSSRFLTEEEDRSVFDNGSTDVVRIDADGTVYVETEELKTSLYPPFGWFCFTQDLAAQLEDYVEIYKDPVSSVQQMISQDFHYSLVNADFSTCIDISMKPDALGSVVVNLADLSEGDLRIVEDMLSASAFPGYEISRETIAGNTFFQAVNPDGTLAVFETYVGGICIDTYVQPLDGSLSDYDMEDVRLILEGFSASGAGSS